MSRVDRGEGRVSAGGWAAAALLLAVVAAVDPWGFRPFTTARWVVVGVVVCIAAAATRWRPPGRLLAAGIGLLLGLLAATVWAVDPLVAIVGHPRRHLGLAGWLVCGLAFLAGTGLSSTDVRRGLGRSAVVAGIVTGGAAIADLAGWDPAGVTFDGGRIGGLLGQPVYLGAVAVLLIPVAVGVAADPTAGVGWRRAAGAAAAGGGVALLTSQTRGAWLGLAVAAGVAAAGAWPAVRGWLLAHRPAVAAGAVVLAGLVVVGPVGDRGMSTFGPVGSGWGRLDEWQVAVSVIADHPLTGAGPEGYRVVAPAHIDDDYARRNGRDEVVDRAHNGVLDVAVTGGLPAALLYVALLAGVVTRCWRVLRRPPDPVVAGAAAGVIAWVAQQAVSFPVAEIDPAAWLVAGAVVVAIRPAPLRSDTGRHRIVRIAGPGVAVPPGPVAIGWAVPRAVAGGLACVLAVGGVLAIAADRDLRSAERRMAASADAAALAAADRATARRPDDVDAWYVAAQVASARPGLLAVDDGLERVEEGLERSPRDPALRSLEEALLVERALRSRLPADLSAAHAAAQALVVEDPSAPAHHRFLGLVLAAQGETERAATELRRALDLDPDDQGARQALDDLATR